MKRNKNALVKFRCARFEKKLLNAKAKRAGLTLSEYCRRAALEDEIIERLSEEQIDLYRTLVQYQINFKRIGNMFRKRNPGLSQEVEKLSEVIKNHLQNFQK